MTHEEYKAECQRIKDLKYAADEAYLEANKPPYEVGQRLRLMEGFWGRKNAGAIGIYLGYYLKYGEIRMNVAKIKKDGTASKNTFFESKTEDWEAII